MIKIRIVTLIVSGFIFLSGCTQLPVKKPIIKNPSTSVSNKQNLWKKRQQSIGRKAAWNLNSKVALRYRADHWNFGLRWLQQSNKHYVMEIKNPVTGGLLAKLTRNSNRVSLLADDGKTYRDSDEEKLLQKRTGVKLPLKGMQYWVRGLASPLYKIGSVTLDANGRPQVLQQAGWKIEYSRYTSKRLDAMPGKVVISRNKDNIYLKIIAKKWQGL